MRHTVSNLRSLPRVCLLLSLSLVLSAAASPALAKSKCFPREGNCVTVTVNGVAAIKMKKKERKEIARYESVSHYVDDAATRIPGTVSGGLDVVPALAPGSESWFGQNVRSEIAVVPLEQVALEVEQKLGVASSVRIGGEAAVTQRLELQSNELPPGAYLLRVTLRGSDNWDRATLFLQVE